METDSVSQQSLSKKSLVCLNHETKFVVPTESRGGDSAKKKPWTLKKPLT